MFVLAGEVGWSSANHLLCLKMGFGVAKGGCLREGDGVGVVRAISFENLKGSE